MDEPVTQIIYKMNNGNREAFADLVTLYKSQVYSICLRMTGLPQVAEDLAQDTFIRAYTNLDKYDTNRKFTTWLYRIATNLSIDYLRKKKPGASLDANVPGTDGLTMYSQLGSGEPGPDEQAVQSELQTRVRAAIYRLPEKYRSAIVLKYLEDLSIKEISEILDIPEATVKTRVHRGREYLRKWLHED